MMSGIRSTIVGLLFVVAGLFQLSSKTNYSPLGKVLTAEAMASSVGASGFLQQCPNAPTTSCPGPGNTNGCTCTTTTNYIETEDMTRLPVSSSCDTRGGNTGCDAS